MHQLNRSAGSIWIVNGQSLDTAYPKARIIDIALQAGVSTATVDRVLNGRSGVRQTTIDKVQQAARLLDKATVRPTIIPTISAGIEIDAVISGGAGFANDMLTQHLLQRGRDTGATVKMSLPHRLDPIAMAEALQKSIDRRASGIIVQSLDHPQVRGVIDEAKALDIPVVSLLTNLPSGSILGYVGLDNRAAGRSAGLLLGRLISEPSEIALFVGGPLYRSHEEREIGFRTLLREEFPELTLLPVCQGMDNPDKNYEMAKDLLHSRPNLRGIVNVGGGNRGLEKALLESGRSADINYFCFNLTPLTRQLLLSGLLDVVIHQDMEMAARIAVDAIINKLTSRETIFLNLPIQIIMRENV